MTQRSARAILVTLLLTAVAMFCLSDLVQAAAPSTMDVGCASRLCDEAAGCGAPAGKPVGLPVAVVVAPITVAAPAPTRVSAFFPELLAYSDRQVVSVHPRAPPSA